MKKLILHSKLFAFGSNFRDPTAKYLNNYTLVSKRGRSSNLAGTAILPQTWHKLIIEHESLFPTDKESQVVSKLKPKSSSNFLLFGSKLVLDVLRDNIKLG